MHRKKKILIAPLDWGLGHATRCIPIIDLLIDLGAEVIIGGAADSLQLLSDEFPGLKTVQLPAYRITYSRGHQQVLKICSQIPRLIAVIRRERKLVNAIVRTHQISGIISDNRYGVRHSDIPSVFMGHQMKILLPAPIKWLQGPLFHLHQRVIHNFDHIWIPDVRGEESLAGELSNHPGLPESYIYLGPLSRFYRHSQTPASFSKKILNQYPPDVLAILSGPEPQRSILERIIINQAHKLPDLIVWVVQGKINHSGPTLHRNLLLVPHLEIEDMNRALHLAKTVISRSGYSSIMDYAVSGVIGPALIPTPGQPEQEYLGQRMMEKGLARAFHQNSFDLQQAILESELYQKPLKIKGVEKNLRFAIGDFFENL